MSSLIRCRTHLAKDPECEMHSCEARRHRAAAAAAASEIRADKSRASLLLRPSFLSPAIAIERRDPRDPVER